MRKHLNKLSWSIRQKVINSKRRVLNWRGDGVHSPYAFNFIRQVIRNPHPFDAFTSLYDKEKGKAFRLAFADDAITKRRILELIFRAVHAHQPQSLYYIGQKLEPYETSLLDDYLRATGYYSPSTLLKECQLVIVEHLANPSLLADLKYPIDYRMVIVNMNSPLVRTWSREARKQLNPPIIFKVVGLEFWVWRTNTTPGVYPVYYK